MEKFVIKSSEDKYWKASFPHWVDQLRHCTVLSESDATEKVNELDTDIEVNFRVFIAALRDERMSEARL